MDRAIDPTGTARIRRSFQAEGNRRLGKLRSLTHTMLVQYDLMAAKGDPLASLFPTSGSRLTTFLQWFERTAREQIGSGWWERFLERAYESGAAAGGELVGRPPPGRTPVPAVLRELAQREFAGIAATMTQQVSRAAAGAVMSGRKPLPLYQAVLTVLRKTGAGRVKSAVNSLTVQFHNLARLESFRAAGVTMIGIDPERMQPAKPSRFLRKHDHAVHDVSREERERIAAEKRAQEVLERNREAAERQAAAAEVRAERARAELERQIGKELAAAALGEKVITASKAEALAELERARAGAKAEIEAAKAATAAREVEAKAAWEAVKEARRAERAALYPARRAAETGLQALTPPPSTPPRPTGYETIRRALFGQPTLPERVLKIAAGGEFLNVLTAGDDRVCPICQDLAAEGPYSLLEAWGMLPAHVNCRCAFVPAFSERNQELEEDIE